MRRNGPILVLVLLTLIGAGVAYSMYYARTQRLREQRATEEAMVAALQSMRGSLRAYHQKHGRYPSSLAELGAIPVDPVTGKSDWTVTTEEVVQPSTDFTAAASETPRVAIVDVRSSATGSDANGKAWSSY